MYPFAIRNCKLTVMMQLGWGFNEAKISQSPYLLGETPRKGKCSSKRKTAFKAEYWRVDAFELWCWRRLLRVPWTMNRSNQSILKEINPEYSLEGLMLKLKLQYFGYLMSWLIRKDPNAGKGWKQEKKGMTEDEVVGWYHWFNGHEFEQTPGDGEGQGNLAYCSPWSQTWLSN